MADEDQDIASVMGFSGFGKKSAMKFDVEKIFEQTKRTAQEYSQQISVKAKAGKVAAGVIDDSDDSEGEGGGGGGGGGGGMESDSDEERVGPPLPPGFRVGVARSRSADVDQDSDEEEEEEDNEFDKRFPVSHEVILKHGSKPVSALTQDPSGARVATGGYDYEVRLWDFAGMDSTLQSFRSLTPCQSHQICSLQYSTTGDSLLVASGNAQAKVLNRDGYDIMECPKGWQYIADMANTDGHISMLNCACWHPKIKEQFLTCSNDCTLRMWDVNNAKKQLQVLKARDKHGRKTAVKTCTFTKDGKLVAGAMANGSIQMWKSAGPFVRPSIQNHDAHTVGTETCCLCFSHDNHTLITRGGDDTLKLWDIRAFRRPINVVTDLQTFFPAVDCVFSPDEQMVLTGTSVRKGQGKGCLVFFDRELKKVHQIGVSDSSVVRCLWHPKLNQIIVGCADGDTKVFFSPKYSIRGAKLCVVKKKRKADISNQVSINAPIITPHALPLFRDDQGRSRRRQREKERLDPVLSKKPQEPLPGKGAGGRVGSGSSLGAYVRKITALEKVDKDQDPREAVLKYAKVAKESPYWVAPAYHSTQPKPVFQEEEDSDDDEKK